MRTTGTILGLDIGRFAVKAVIADRRDPRRILRREVLRLPSGGGERGELIRNWLAGLNLGRPPCVLGLPGGGTLFQSIRLDANDPRPMETVAALEVLKFNEIASEQMVYAITPASLTPGEKRFLIAMARPTLLNGLVNTAQELGLDLVDIVAAPVAAYNALAGAGGMDETCLYIDIGQSATQVAVGTGRQLLFARAFANGGQSFTDAVARHAKLAYAEAESFKVERGSLADAESPSSQGLRAAAEGWIREVESCLGLHANAMPDPKARPVRIVLSGGAAALRGLAAYVQTKLRLPTAVATALPAAGAAAGESPGTEFVVAAGLARTGSPAAVVRLSLLPAALRENLLFRSQKPYWVAAGVAAALTLAVLLTGGCHEQRRRESHLRQQQTRLIRLQELVDDIQAERAANDELRALAQPLVALLAAGPVMRDLITLIADSKDTNDCLTLVCDADTYFQGLPKPPAKTATAAHAATPPAPDEPPEVVSRFERVIVEGYTQESGLVTVNDLIGKLRGNAAIASADLLSDDARAGAAVALRGGARPPAGGRAFSIDIQLRTP